MTGTAMQITLGQADGMSVLRIAGDLRIASVAEAKPDLVALLAAGTDTLFDLSMLGECDTAGIQLLLMTCASLRAKGRRCVTTGATAAFQAALDRIGIPVACFEPQDAATGNRQDDRGQG